MFNDYIGEKNIDLLFVVDDGEFYLDVKHLLK